MLNLFQHLLIYRILRVKPERFAEGNPAMTGALKTGFLEVPNIVRSFLNLVFVHFL